MTTNYDLINNVAFYSDGSDANNNTNNEIVVDKQFQESLNTGPRGGTSIKDLQQSQQPQKQFQYQPLPPQTLQQDTQQIQQKMLQLQQQTLQLEQKINQQQKILQSQSQNDNSSQNSKLFSKIKKMGNNINNKLLEKSENSIIDSQTESESVISYDDNDNIEINNKSYLLNYLRDASLIVIIYVILSQDFLKRTIGTYLPQINSDSVVGTIIYGILHAILYIIFRML